MKEGLGYLTRALQLYLKVEIQDASQLPPNLDVFQTFAKVSVNLIFDKSVILLLNIVCYCEKEHVKP